MKIGNDFGFTLIELMIVIAVIAILASIAIPSYKHHVKSSKALELVDAANVLKGAVVRCMVLHRSDFSVCQQGQEGIPPTISSAAGYVANQTVKANGVISVTGTSAVDNVIYELHPALNTNTDQITFTIQSSDCSLFSVGCTATSDSGHDGGSGGLS